MKGLIDDRAFVFLGPLAIAAIARQAGHEVEILDLTGHSRACPKPIHDEACARATLDDARRRVADLAARSDVVGCYSMAALHFFVAKFLTAIREGNPAAIAVLGGPHASTAPERCAAEGWDYVVVADQGGGGGEPGLLEVLRRAERRLAGAAAPRRPALPMLSDATGGGACVSLASRAGPVILGPDCQDVIVRAASRDPAALRGRFDYSNDRWPYPARDLIDFDSYRYVLDGRRFASIVTQAGCVYRCSFCAHSEGYTKLVLRSPEHVRGELRDLKRRYPWVGGVMFYDDELNIRGDLQDLLDMLEHEGHALDLTFRAFFKSGRKYMTDDLFSRLARAGFTHLCTGAEAAHPAVLELVGKGATVEDNTAFVRLCVRHGIKPKVFTMVGLPNESPESVEALARWLEDMAAEGLSDADTTICTPTSGTPLYEQAAKWLAGGLIHFDKRELDSNDEAVNYKGHPGQYKSFVSTPTLSREDIVRARAMVERRFRKAARLAPLAAAGKDDG